jgi:phage replication initiation protein
LLGAFNNGGRDPKANPVGFSPFGDEIPIENGDGRTFYVGSRDSDLLYRGYEKGKQQGDPRSPWVRHEVEWKGRDRVIPLDVVLRPHEYLAGMYPALAWISSVRCVVPVMRKRMQIAYAALVESCRVSYGRLLWAMAEIEGSVEAAFARLVAGVDDVPKRLLVPV